MPTDICRAEMTWWHEVWDFKYVCQQKREKNKWKKGKMLMVIVAGWWEFRVLFCFVLILIKMKRNKRQSLREKLQPCFYDSAPHVVMGTGGQRATVIQYYKVTVTLKGYVTSKGEGCGKNVKRGSFPTGNLSALQKWVPHIVYLFLPLNCNLIAQAYDD